MRLHLLPVGFKNIIDQKIDYLRAMSVINTCIPWIPWIAMFY